MPNRPSLQRGSPREQAVLEALRSGATRQGAAAAGGVSRRTLYRHLDRSPAFRHDLELAEDEAERRMTAVVVGAAVAGDVKAAMFWLERRRAADYRLQTQQQIDGMVLLEQEYPAELLAMCRRYAGLTAAEAEQEIKALGWVTEQPTIPTSAAPDEASLIMGGASAPNGGTAIARPAQQSPAPTDEAARVARNGAKVDEGPLPPLQVDVAAPGQPCQHCRGTVPGHHEDGCPTFEPDGRLKVTQGFVIGDPR